MEGKNSTLWELLVLIGAVGGGIYLWSLLEKMRHKEKMQNNANFAFSGPFYNGSQMNDNQSSCDCNKYQKPIPVEIVDDPQIDYPPELLQQYPNKEWGPGNEGWGPMNASSPFMEIYFPETYKAQGQDQ